MKKSLFSKFLATLTLLVFVGTTVQATIVQGTIGNGDYEGSQAYGLDFNNDGTIEYYITFGANQYADFTNTTIMFSWTEGGNNVWTSGTLETEGWDNVHALTAGTSIGASANWEAQGDAYLVPFYGEPVVPLNQEIYVGFRLKFGSNVHYGWAKVKVTGSETAGYSAQWISCAYENTPNTAIAAGATTSPTAVADNEQLSVSVYPNPVTDYVVVEGANNAEVAVFDMNGRSVQTEAVAIDNRTEINMKEQPAGIYFVRVNGRSIKVVKK